MMKVTLAVPTFPAASVAVTTRVYVPWSRIAVPSVYACPFSVASTVTGLASCTTQRGVTDAARVSRPAGGWVITTRGGVRSMANRSVRRVSFPAPSRAITVRLCAPSAVTRSPDCTGLPSTVPCTVTGTVSVTVHDTDTDAALEYEPLAGLVMLTSGGVRTRVKVS